MATTRIMPLHIGKGRTESRAISDIIDYVANPQKTDNGKLITGLCPCPFFFLVLIGLTQHTTRSSNSSG